MNNEFCSPERDCAQSCTHTCADQPLQTSPSPEFIDFEKALERFHQEAIQGVCVTERYRMPYFTWGEGPPLLFIHGLSDTSRSFLQPISVLSARFRCIAYDLPSGRGDGARLWGYRHDDLVADVFALMNHLGLQRSYLCASSFGATIALEALRRWPDLLPRAILQGGLAWRPLRRAELLLARLGRFLPGRMAQLPLRKQALLKTQFHFFTNRTAAVWEWFLNCSGEAPIATVARQALWLHEVDLRPTLADIRQPVLLLCGDQDRTVPWTFTQVLHQSLPNVGLAVLEGCGHVPSYSHPEAMAEVIRQFLTPPRD